MNKHFKSAMAACLMIFSTASCGGGSSSVSGEVILSEDMPSYYNVAGDDLEYGTTLIELKPESDENIKIMTAFDKRWFGGENQDFGEIYKIADYLYALNTGDAELMKNTFYPGYLEHMAHQNALETADDYINASFNAYRSKLGEDFEFDYIDVSKCLLEGDNDAVDMFAFADEAIIELSGVETLSKITSRKFAEIGGSTTYKTSEGTYQLINHSNPIIVCIYQIDGQYYLF